MQVTSRLPAEADRPYILVRRRQYMLHENATSQAVFFPPDRLIYIRDTSLFLLK